MYEKYYGLTGKPFQLNPDPQFYYASTQHRRAMAFVDYGLHQSEGFIVVTGDIGAGKTTVVRSLLGNLDPARVVAVNIVTTQVDPDDLLRLVASAFAVRARDLSKADLLMQIEAVLAAHCRDGRRCLLIVDEAQNLGHRAVEELRMLSNFQLGTHALLQTFLVGQPEFRHMLQGPDLEQLRQRVIAACHIGPMDADETRAYVQHRLRTAGWTDKPQIADAAFKAAHELTGGVPRRLNLLFDRVLLAGFLGDRRSVTEDNIREVHAEIADETAAGVPKAQAAERGREVATAEVVDFARMRSRRLPEMNVDAEMEWGASIHRLEDELHRLAESMARVERGNQATVALLKRFLDWVRTQEESARAR